MGKLIGGEWHDLWYDTKRHGGKFIRNKTQFHHQKGPQLDFTTPHHRERFV